MQCPKCGREAELPDITEPGKCPACGVYYHKVLRESTPSPELEASPVASGKPNRLWAALSAGLAIFCAAVYWGYGAYQRHALVEQVEASMRMANSYVAEILDESARITNGEYLQKVPRRIAELDSLVASTLAIDDSAIPGIGSAAAEYAKASRGMLNSFTDHLKTDIRLSMVEAGHRVYAGYPSTQEGLEYLGKTDAQLDAENELSLAAVTNADDTIEKIKLLSASAEHAKQLQRRNAYLKSVAEVNEAREQADLSTKALDAAGRRIQIVGDKVSSLADRPMPTRAWQIPRT